MPHPVRHGERGHRLLLVAALRGHGMTILRKPDLGPWIVERLQIAFAAALLLAIVVILATGWGLAS